MIAYVVSEKKSKAQNFTTNTCTCIRQLRGFEGCVHFKALLISFGRRALYTYIKI